MCGIIGLISKNSIAERDWLTGSRDSLLHRGPDASGEWWSDDGRVGLAHRRLSILDLSPLGHQPMHHPKRGLSIVFNGEIYNYAEIRQELEGLGHSFHSQSDTEVLLAAYAQWGVDCLTRLNGMFAFALYDAPQKQVFIARDRAGEKPLFYRSDEGDLYFASELKALLAFPSLPRHLDAEAMDCYLAMGFVPGDRCILKGYRKLPPAHAMVFNLNNGALNVWRYWQLPSLVTPPQHRTEIELLKTLEDLLEDAVSKQLVADVPVGILLSGGVDSSLVTAMAARRAPHIKTFSIRFPGYGTYDETDHARLIANHFQTDHTELVAEASTADLLPRLAQQYDEPLVDSSMIPTYLVTQLVRQHCTVALGGDGGDELFGGYGHYSRLLWMQRNLGLIPAAVRRLIARSAELALPVGFKGRNWLQGLDVDFKRGVPLIANYFDVSTRRKLLPAHRDAIGIAEAIRQSRVPPVEDLLQRATRMDFENYLSEDILVKVDRASMLSSLEMRAPFLDHRLIEFAFGQVPSHFKANEAERKILLKRLAAKVLPPDFDKQRKQGFSIPLAEWLKKGPFRDLFWSVLTDSNCIFERRTVTDLLAGQDRGHSNSERLFALVQFDLWRREYRISR